MVANSLNESLMTVEEVAAYLCPRPETVRSMARRKQLPSLKVGHWIWRFQRSEIDAFLEKKKSLNILTSFDLTTGNTEARSD